MKTVLFTYSRHGCDTARKILSSFKETEFKAYTMERFADADFLPILRDNNDLYGEMFEWADAMIFVSSCGIAVRKISPYIKDKCKDPAVICVDDLGKFVIPVLSGHIGGANELAKKIADKLGALAVITTATDINNKFSADAWAAKCGFVIDSMSLAKEVSATILESDIPVFSDFPVALPYPSGTYTGKSGELGIFISYKKEKPFKKTLNIIPPCLNLGIGCRKGTKAETIGEAVDSVLKKYNIDRRAIKRVASIDLKANEEGLLEYCTKNGLEIFFYTAEELKKAEGNFTSSSFVESVTGVGNVCERAAFCSGGKIIVPKTCVNGVTVAIAEENLEVCFE